MKDFDVTEFDMFFLSYDEPNADLHYSDLLDKAPWASRVHGIKGFDAAHRACAERSESDWFITVDGDNTVLTEFFNQKVTFDPLATPNRCFSWNAVNQLNGLIYGNGGIKLWSKQFVLQMNSHENADDQRKAVDFCWEDDYKQIHQPFSEVWITGSPYQAFKAGFREGVKLTLDRGQRIPAELMRYKLHPVNLRNARIWSCVGADSVNGLWAMLGARMGWDRMCDPTWDYTIIRDYDWFTKVWDTVAEQFGGDNACKTTDRLDTRFDLIAAVEGHGHNITSHTKIPLPALGKAESAFFRDTFKLRND